jgi:hypothetical protein
LWGAPRIHGELLKLGFEIAESTVSKYMIRHRGPPSQTWRTFLRNHADAIAAIDLCVVPTVNFERLFVLLVLGHGRSSRKKRPIYGPPITHTFLLAEENWAECAAGHGWNDLELFGCCRRPLERLGSAGLLWAINGGRLVELRRDWAVIACIGPISPRTPTQATQGSEHHVALDRPVTMFARPTQWT